MLQLRDLRKNYEGRDILVIPEITLESGIYWIEGVNGSGKTTLLKMIAGMVPFEGDILFNNKSVVNHPVQYRQCCSWAMAEPVYPEFISGTDLIEMYRHIRKANKDETDNLVSMFNMSDYIGDSTGTYSTGMTKKLSLVLALIGRPPLMILDEPLITLDRETVEIMCNLIIEWNNQSKITFLLSSHHDLDIPISAKFRKLLVTNKNIQFSA